MHIPDGFLTGEAAAARHRAPRSAGVAVCLRGAAGTARERDLPLAGLAAAFFLVGDAPLVPITVGTQGHLLGGALAVALLGPWLGGADDRRRVRDPGARARRRRDHDARADDHQPRARARRSSATRCCSRCAGCCRSAVAARPRAPRSACCSPRRSSWPRSTLGAAVAIDRTAIAVSTLGAYAVIAVDRGRRSPR